MKGNTTDRLSMKPFTCFSRTDSRSLGSDDTASSPRTPDGLTWLDLISLKCILSIFRIRRNSGVCPDLRRNQSTSYGEYSASEGSNQSIDEIYRNIAHSEILESFLMIYKLSWVSL